MSINASRRGFLFGAAAIALAPSAVLASAPDYDRLTSFELRGIGSGKAEVAILRYADDGRYTVLAVHAVAMHGGKVMFPNGGLKIAPEDKILVRIPGHPNYVSPSLLATRHKGGSSVETWGSAG